MMDTKWSIFLILSNFLAILATGFVIVEKDLLSEKKSSIITAEFDLLRPRDTLDGVDFIQPIDVESIVIDDSESSFKNDVSKSDVIDSSEFETINGISCRKCPPGIGLVAMCNATHQTICEPCQSGVSYSSDVPHFRPCSPCSRCGPGMFVDKKCSSELDTFCDWCHGVKNTDYLRILLSENEDFVEKCDVIASLNKLNAEELTQDQSHDSSEELQLVTEVIEGQSSTAVDPFLAVDELIIEDTEDSEAKQIKQDKIASKAVSQMSLLVSDGNVQKPVPDNALGDQGIVYKPSVHNYPYEELVHQRHPNSFLLKIVESRNIILAVACISCFIMILLIFRRRSCRASQKAKEVWITSSLTDEDDRIIHECAQKMMDQEQKCNEKSQNRRFNPFSRQDDSSSEDENETEQAFGQVPAVNVRENPLIGYLEHEIERSKIDDHDTSKNVDV